MGAKLACVSTTVLADWSFLLAVEHPFLSACPTSCHMGAYYKYSFRQGRPTFVYVHQIYLYIPRTQSPSSSCSA